MSQTFEQLLTMAKEQPQPQRLLFLFAQADHNKSNKSKKMQRGSLSPVMCVDKLIDELSSFDELVKEADSVASNWQFIFIAGLSGENNQAPTTEQAEPYLNKMTNDLTTGQNIGQYVVIDRAGDPIEMMAN